MTFFSFLTTHIEMFIWGSVALILVAGIALLVRGVKDEIEGHTASGINIKEIEGLLKNVLSQTNLPRAEGSAPSSSGEVTVSGEGGGATGPGVSSEELAKLNTAVSERELKIQKLTDDLEAAKFELSKREGGGADPLKILELEEKLKTAEARLEEYSIIEDDIADLGLFREENSKLKGELDSLKAKLSEAEKNVGVAQDAASKAQAEMASRPVAEASLIDKPPVAPLQFEPAEKFGLSADDPVMQQFAAFAADSSAPKVELDTSMFLTEGVESDPELEALARGMSLPAAAASPVESVQKPEQSEAPKAATAAMDPQALIDAMMQQELEQKAKLEADIKAQLEQVKQTEASPENSATEIQAKVGAEDGSESGSEVKDKMIAEIEALPTPQGDDGDVLAEGLDTDKLLQEVDSLAAQPINPSDDLMGEFLEPAKDGT